MATRKGCEPEPQPILYSKSCDYQSLLNINIFIHIYEYDKRRVITSTNLKQLLVSPQTYLCLNYQGPCYPSLLDLLKHIYKHIYA